MYSVIQILFVSHLLHRRKYVNHCKGHQKQKKLRIWMTNSSQFTQVFPSFNTETLTYWEPLPVLGKVGDRSVPVAMSYLPWIQPIWREGAERKGKRGLVSG